MPSINEIQLRDTYDEIDGKAIPEQFGGIMPTPQPGPYAFHVPANVTDAWEPFDEVQGTKVIQRLRLVFDRDHPLFIAEAYFPAGKEFVGTRLDTRISTQPRKQSGVFISDMFFFLRDGFGFDISGQITNAIWAAMANQTAGLFFKAHIELTARCRTDADIYGEDNKPIVGRKGCGARFYQSTIPKVEGLYQTRFACPGTQVNGEAKPCGGMLRAFPQLSQFSQYVQAQQ